MRVNRRKFLVDTTALSAAVIVPTVYKRGFGSISKYADSTGAKDSSELMSDELINNCVLRAVDAAKSAGASFVDARITRTVAQSPTPDGSTDKETVTFGVRAFVGGVFGFASSPYIDLEEAGFLAESAVSQARINSQVFPRDIDLGSYPAVKGEWSTPVRIDPFSIPIEEKADYLGSFKGAEPRYVRNRTYGVGIHDVVLSRVEKVVATSEGSLYKQTLYEAGGRFTVVVEATIDGDKQRVTANSPDIIHCGAGWELYLDANLHDQIPKLIEEAEKNLNLYPEPVQVGKYDIVATAGVAASFVVSTLADATQLDRIVGYEANAGGTSYLGPDYLSNLGMSFGSSEIQIRADRSMPRGLATTKWDDEGVETKEFDLVKDGKLVDYQTTREMSGFMSEWYKSQNREIKSNGCCRTDEGAWLPMLHTPNLTLLPGKGASTFDEMVASTERGIAFIEGGVGTDFQSRTGFGGGMLRDIRDGVLGPVLLGAEVLFDSKEFWKSVKEIGNGKETSTGPVFTGKGQPGQPSRFTVKSVPLRIKDMAVIDGTRKA